MKKLTGKGKAALIVLIVAVTAAAGFVIENYTGERFTQDIITRSDEVSYSSSAPSEVDGKININSATAEELELIDGIGSVLAQRIIDYREENGAFSQTEGIMLVSGIGEKMYENIKDKICVE